MEVVVKKNIAKMYLLKILKKLHLNNVIYKLIRKSLLKKEDIEYVDIDKVKDELNSISPRPVGSACGHNEILEKKVNLQIIIPCYNVEKFLKSCLDSIVSQETEYTYKVIIVDDGATDSTPEIIDLYSKYPNVEIIHQKNKGLSGARNTGLKKIYSDYVMFVDSDDLIPPGTVQGLLKCAYKNNADIVGGTIINFDRFGRKKEIKYKDLNNIDPYKYIDGYAWGKVIKSSLFENIIFPEGFWYEDSIMAFLIYPLTKSSATYSKPVYYYRRNTAGITNTARKNLKGLDSYWIFEQMIENEKELGIPNQQKIYEHIMYQVYLNYNRMYWFNDEVKQKVFILSANIINNEYKNFETENLNFKDLEKALRTNNFTLYKYYCSLH